MGDGARALYKAQLGDTLADASRVFRCLGDDNSVPCESGIALVGVWGFTDPGQGITGSYIFVVRNHRMNVSISILSLKTAIVTRSDMPRRRKYRYWPRDSTYYDVRLGQTSNGGCSRVESAGCGFCGDDLIPPVLRIKMSDSGRAIYKSTCSTCLANFST